MWDHQRALWSQLVDIQNLNQSLPYPTLTVFHSINDTQSPVGFLWLSSPSVSALLSVCSPEFALFSEEVGSTVPPRAWAEGPCTRPAGPDIGPSPDQGHRGLSSYPQLSLHGRVLPSVPSPPHLTL